MNKIKVKESNLDNLSSVKVEEHDNKLIITFLEDNFVEIEDSHNYDEYIVNINKNVNVNIYEFNEKTSGSNYTFNIHKNANLNITKFYHNSLINETNTINLLEENANIDFNIKTIATEKQNFNIFVNHISKKTTSNIKNCGVNVDGEINFNLESKVPNGIIGCEANQNSRIINFTDNLCTIKPNLLIDETDVVANHSALIGKFEDDELFYLQSRGIDYVSALKMLVKGFLKVDNDKKVDKLLDKYWR